MYLSTISVYVLFCNVNINVLSVDKYFGFDFNAYN